MSDDDPLTVADLVEYCRTQAALLSGRTETLGAETEALLDEIDDDIADLRSRLAARSTGTDAPETPSGPDGEVADLESLEDDLEEKRAVAEAKQARMSAFRELSEGYADLAEDVETADDWRAALDRVVAFERERDAPAYFDDRQTLLEAAAEAGEE
jgi:hypothetical protein